MDKTAFCLSLWRNPLTINKNRVRFAAEISKTLLMKDGFSGERSLVVPPMVVDMEREDLLTASLFVTAIGYYPHAGHHYCRRDEGCGDHVLIYCVDGSGWYRLGGRTCEVSAGDYFILPAGCPHAYGSSEGGRWTIYWIHFNGMSAGVYAEGAQEPQRINTTRHSRMRDRNNIFEEILATLSRGYSLEHLRYASALLHHYLASMRYLELYRSSGIEGVEGAFIDPVSAAIHYMQEHVEQHVTVDDVLRYVGYSQSYFTSLFRSSTGYSPMAYINQLKVQAACHWLEQTDLRVNQICHKVGIEDPYYFSRLFAKTMGVSPQEYRGSVKAPKPPKGECNGGPQAP